MAATSKRTGPGGDGVATSALSRLSILKAEDLATTHVDVPEWGGRVWIRELTATDRARFDEAFFTAKQSIEQAPAGRNVRGKRRRRQAAKVTTSVEIHAHAIKTLLVWLTMCDEGGKRLFDAEEDLAELGKKGAKPITTVYEASAVFNGISNDEDIEDAAGE